jgi:ParB family chromosome partitioning protein
VLDEVIARGLNVRQTEVLARKVADQGEDENASPPEPAPADPQTAHLEDAFRQALGTRVRLVRGRRGGRLVIHFFSEDELQGLYEAIVERSS